MDTMSVRPGRKVCEAMRGLVEEAQHEIEEQDAKGPILDLVIVAGMQRIEHYEIAAYGTGRAVSGSCVPADRRGSTSWSVSARQLVNAAPAPRRWCARRQRFACRRLRTASA